jgi:tetratricopeptide (TPR) repeat protein
MSRVYAAVFVSLIAVMAVGGQSRAEDPARRAKLKTVLVPRKASTMRIRPSECLQKTPELFLWDGKKQIVPSAAGFVYVVEQNDGQRLLVSDLNEGNRGWTSPSAMIPVEKAVEYFSGLIKIAPQNAFAYVMRGVARVESDDLEHAAGDFAEALKVDPKYVPALIARAGLWQWRGRLDKAIADADQAIELDPRNSYAYVERGVFLYDLKRYTEAASDLGKASALGSRAAVIHTASGMMNIEKKELTKAQAEFNTAIELDPKDPDAYAGYASLYILRGKVSAAISVLDQAIDADPQNPESHGYRAELYLSLGKHAKALEDLDEVIRFAPNSARALRERAWLLATCADARIRKPEEAIASATRACELTEWNEPRTLLTLAAACSEAGDFAGAVKWQQKALDRLAENRPEAREYRRLLDRYKASKPYHRLGLLKEGGIQFPGIAAKKG